MKTAWRLIGVLLLGAAVSVAADVLLVNADGRKIILHDSGTWEFAPDAPQDSERAAVAPSQPSQASPAAPVATATEVPHSQQSLLVVVGGVALLLLLAIAGMAWFFLILQPSRKRQLLLAAIEIIERQDEAQYGHAAQLLGQAITAGLEKEDIREAYFARAFLYAKEDNLDGAAADLALADRGDPAVLYLHLWVKVKMKKFKEAFDLYDSNKPQLVGYLQADTLMSLACFSLGAEHWKKQDIEAAVSYFDRVRSLKVHAGKVPAAISDLQVTQGVTALFNNHAEEAAQHFAAAVEQATKEKRSDVMAKLGQLLCNWRQQEHPNQDAAIAELLARIEKETPAAMPAQVPGAHAQEESAAVLPEAQVLRRNVGLLHAVSLLHSWFHLADKQKLSNTQIGELEKRAARVTSVDPHMPDPQLLLGLIEYYFCEERHDCAVKRLTEAATDIPEVTLLLRREAKLKELERDRLKTYFCIQIGRAHV